MAKMVTIEIGLNGSDKKKIRSKAMTAKNLPQQLEKHKAYIQEFGPAHRPIYRRAIKNLEASIALNRELVKAIRPFAASIIGKYAKDGITTYHLGYDDYDSAQLALALAEQHGIAHE